jgi:hypothetical protein
LIALA